MAKKNFTYPAISVIIPMYNVEQYVGECLDSLLAQTFQDFEVIVVDDCSTDSSCAVVESYAPKFDGRLKLTKTVKNSGGAGFPRNRGIELARGEYISFLDPDDTITPTALEEMYYHVKNFNADIVQCEKYYHIPEKSWNDGEFRRQLKPFNYLTGENRLVKESVLWTDNFEERIKVFAQRLLIWNVVVQLIRRNVIIKNEIRFCDIYAEDMLFFICELCCARKYVVVPNVAYNYRIREGSSTSAKQNVPQLLQRQIKALKRGVKYLDEFLSAREFFSRRRDLKLILFNAFANQLLKDLNGLYAQIPLSELNELSRREFGDDSALTAFIFGAMNLQRLQLAQAQHQINQIVAQAQTRIAALERENSQLKDKERTLCQKLSEQPAAKSSVSPPMYLIRKSPWSFRLITPKSISARVWTASSRRASKILKLSR